jgi:CheY-like chemotaxis protein/predicted regulator of Ras-like GTPase activity (Roadblock/LC7/MglB family)
MSKKRVLIVDDAKDLLFLLTHSVKRLGPEYEVSTATDVPTALKQLQNQTFDLVLTDYMMGSLTGLDLAGEVQKISPKTQVVLMSAYDTNNLRDTVKSMQLSGYVNKPFTIPQVLEVVAQAIAHTTEPALPPPAPVSPTDQTLNQTLKMVYTKTGAHYVLLLDARGHPLRVVGQTDSATLSRVAAFVAANFLAVTELASLLGDNHSVFNSIYHEGDNYNIYAHDINGEYLLAVVFGTKDKPGTVWFYTKRAAITLSPLLKTDTPNEELVPEVSETFNQLFEQEQK